MDKNDKMELISAVRAAIEIDNIAKAININLVNVMRLKPELVSRCEAAGLNCEIEYETGSVVMGEMVGVQDSADMYVKAHEVAQAMMRRGGAFVQELGSMLAHADYENSKKIKATWPEYWREYEEMSKEDYSGKEAKDEAK